MTTSGKATGDPQGVAPDRAQLFTGLFERHFEAVTGYALRRSTPGEASDAVSETFLVAWRRLDDVPDEPDSRAWLLGVTWRVLANQRRGLSRRRRLGDQLRSELRHLTPPRDAEGTDCHVVREALGELSEVDRELILLTLWEGLTPAQIAIALEIAPGAARTRLHRARGRLRALLDLDDPGEPVGRDGDESADDQEHLQRSWTRGQS